MYHTQELREENLKEPQKCTRNDAWLGEAYYFWLNIDDAEMWGHNSKRETGAFQIYSCNIVSDNILDTVFNETEYNFWVKIIEKVAKIFVKKTYNKPTLKELNDYIKERGDWKDVHGVLFQDLPAKEYYSKVKPIEYKDKTTGSVKKTYFAYKKRVQLAVYNTEIIHNFAHCKDEMCIEKV